MASAGNRVDLVWSTRGLVGSGIKLEVFGKFVKSAGFVQWWGVGQQEHTRATGDGKMRDRSGQAWWPEATTEDIHFIRGASLVTC